MNEKEYDQLLNITTTGKQKVYSVTSHYHRYEPTPYEALEGLFREYHLKQGDRVVDFGCGKGRISFYINHFYQNAVTGVEVNEDFYKDALNNLDLYLKNIKRAEIVSIFIALWRRNIPSTRWITASTSLTHLQCRSL